MATTYDVVYKRFLDKITDYDLPLFSDIQKEDILNGYLKSAIVDFKRPCKTDLTDRDDEYSQFNITLDDEIIEILAEIMVEKWLQPKLNNTENLKNALSTKDFSVFSPANLLDKIQTTYSLTKKQSKSLIRGYSFINSDIEELKNAKN
jgi:hypothetical protein